jgi:hypothetical protein
MFILLFGYGKNREVVVRSTILKQEVYNFSDIQQKVESDVHPFEC